MSRGKIRLDGSSCMRRRADRQSIVATQRPTVPAAKSGSETGPTTVKHRWHVNTTSDSDGCTTPSVQHQQCARVRAERMPRWNRRAIEGRRYITTGERDQCRRIELQRNATKRAVEHRRAALIADEKIREAMRLFIHRAADRYTKMLPSGSPQILHGGLNPG